MASVQPYQNLFPSSEFLPHVHQSSEVNNASRLTAAQATVPHQKASKSGGQHKIAERGWESFDLVEQKQTSPAVAAPEVCELLSIRKIIKIIIIIFWIR